MLKINNTKLKKCRIPLLLIMISLGGVFLYQYLTFIPEYSSATEISTEDSITPVKEWDKLKYMQQMTLEACNSVDTPAAKNGTTINTNVPAKQLIDSRDGKTYWIAKLADGNCWMTQNLDLDLYDSAKGENRTLTPEDSNVSENWVSTTGPSTISGYSSSNYYLAQYYDPGDKYCNTSNCNATTTSNDEHDHQGNFYSWTAATADTGTKDVIFSEAQSSICPKGWKLPTGSSNEATKKSFGGLTTTYGIDSNVAGSNALRATPLYFIYSGYVYNSKLGDVGNYGGRYWPSTAGDSDSAYYLGFGNSYVYPIVSSYRYYGFSIRCVAADTSDSTPPTPDDSIKSPDISVTVPNILTLEVTDSVTMEDIVANTTNTQEFTATVTSNVNYSLNLNATNTDAYATSLVNIKDDQMIGHIDSISSPSTTLNPNQWGIKACSSLLASCDGALFQPLPAKNQNPDSINPFFTSTPGSHTHLFQIGINPSSSLPSGTYSTTIQVTAATSD